MDNEFDPLPASEPISPELVLVDPELAARVRRNAIAGPSFAASDRASQPLPVEGIPLPVVSHDATPPLPRRRAARRAPARIGWAVTLVALVGVLGAAFAGPRNAADPDRTDARPLDPADHRSRLGAGWFGHLLHPRDPS